MARPAQRALDLIRSKHPDAFVTERDAGSLTCAYGAFHRTRAFGGAMHYQDLGEWHEIDTAWTPATGAWQYEMLLAPYLASARDAFNVGDIVEYRARSGEWLRFQPLSINWRDANNSQHYIDGPKAVATQVTGEDGDVLSWPHAFRSGVSMRWQAHPDALQKLLEIDSLASLPEPAAWLGAGIDFELTFAFNYHPDVVAVIDGVAWDRSAALVTGEAVEFRLGEDTLWTFAAPKAIDANGDEITGRLRFYGQDGVAHVSVRVPREWLLTAAYPVLIDPEVHAGYLAQHGVGWETRYTTATVATTQVVGNEEVPPFEHSRHMALLFRDVAIPKDATVVSARVSLRASTTQTGEVCKVNLNLWDTDDAGLSLTTDVATLEGYPRTTSVPWTIPPLTSSQTTRTPDLGAQVTEVVGRAGWASGNSLAFFFQDDGSDVGAHRTFNTSATTSVFPILTVDYGLPEPGHYLLDGTDTSWLYAPHADLGDIPLTASRGVMVQMLVAFDDWEAISDQPLIGKGVEAEASTGDRQYQFWLASGTSARITYQGTSTTTGDTVGLAALTLPPPGVARWVRLVGRYTEDATTTSVLYDHARDTDGTLWPSFTASSTAPAWYVQSAARDTRVGMSQNADLTARASMKVFAIRIFTNETGTTTFTNQVADADFRIDDQSAGDSLGVRWLNAGGATYVPGYVPPGHLYVKMITAYPDAVIHEHTNTGITYYSAAAGKYIFITSIQDGGDDVHGRDGDEGVWSHFVTLFSASSSSLSAGDTEFGVWRYVLRLAVAIPQAANITTAMLTVVSTNTDSNTVDNFLYCEAVDDAAAMIDAADYRDRSWGATTTTWPSVQSVTEGAVYSSPNFAATLQEVVNREGWESGNHTNIGVGWVSGAGRRNIAAFENATYDPASLYVEYSLEDEDAVSASAVLSLPTVTTVAAGELTVPEGFTLLPASTISSDGIVNENGQTIDLHASVNEPWADPDDDATYLVNASSVSGHVWLEMVGVPEDLLEVRTLRVRVRARRE